MLNKILFICFVDYVSEVVVRLGDDEGVVHGSRRM